jgi:hypothetical protein
MINYQNSKIYRIYIEYYDDEKQIQELNYIGATTQTLAQRYAKHKRNYERWINEEKKENKKKLTSVYLFEKGEPQIELICPYPCNNKEELDKKENEYIRQYNCVNRRIAGRTRQEWIEEHKEQFVEKYKEYRKTRKVEIKERDKKYYEENKEDLLEKKKNYYNNNKKQIAEKGASPYNCVCGSTFRYSDKSRHFKTDKHQSYLEDNLFHLLDL